MRRLLKKFRADEAGAVTVDWVVLTAALVGLGVAVASTIGAGAMNKSSGLGATLSNMDGGS